MNIQKKIPFRISLSLSFGSRQSGHFTLNRSTSSSTNKSFSVWFSSNISIWIFKCVSKHPSQHVRCLHFTKRTVLFAILQIEHFPWNASSWDEAGCDGPAWDGEGDSTSSSPIKSFTSSSLLSAMSNVSSWDNFVLYATRLRNSRAVILFCWINSDDLMISFSRGQREKRESKRVRTKNDINYI